MVENIYDGEGQGVVWNVEVLRNLNDWEVGEYEELLQLLVNVKMKTNSDSLVWKQKHDGNFTVKSYYEVLMGYNSNEASQLL